MSSSVQWDEYLTGGRETPQKRVAEGDGGLGAGWGDVPRSQPSPAPLSVPRPVPL